MREFEMYELVPYKCTICGCKNKIYTELLLDRAKCDHFPPNVDKYVVGYSTKCCNCGYRMDWIDDTDDYIAHINHHVIAGRSLCIQPSYCPHKDCKLYGTCNMEDVLHPNKPEPPKNSHFNELDVKPSIMPKFL